MPTSNQPGLGQDAQAETSSRGVGVLTTAGRLGRIDGGSRGIGELGMRNVGRMDGWGEDSSYVEVVPRVGSWKALSWC